MPVISQVDYVIPSAAKGACYLCGCADSKKGYLNFSVEIRGEGDVVICVPCIHDAAQQCGMVSEKLLQEAAKDIQKLKAKNAELEARVVPVEEAIDQFARAAQASRAGS